MKKEKLIRKLEPVTIVRTKYGLGFILPKGRKLPPIRTSSYLLGYDPPNYPVPAIPAKVDWHNVFCCGEAYKEETINIGEAHERETNTLRGTADCCAYK